LEKGSILSSYVCQYLKLSQPEMYLATRDL
jgi:hypothetical protein